MNIMKMASGTLTPILANKLASAFGVPSGVAKMVLSVALPVVMAAILKRGAAPDGVQAIGTAMGSMPKTRCRALATCSAEAPTTHGPSGSRATRC